MQTLFIGQNRINLHEVDSTNTYAIGLLKSVKLPEGSLIITKKQTAGRGQRGNTWQAEEGVNLTFSVVLHPKFLSQENHFYLSMISSLAVFGALTECLKHSQADIKVKWPNDILVMKDGNPRKIAGILIENFWRGNALSESVIGIGLNVNQTSFSKDIEDKATSIYDIIGQEMDLDFVLEKVLSYLESFYLKLKTDSDSIKKMYLKYLYQINAWYDYKLGNEIMQGKIIEVENDGRLILELKSGEKKAFLFKEIAF